MTNTNVFGIKAETTPVAGAEAPQPTEANRSEEDTLSRARTGDQQALEALLAGARSRLCAVALKMMRDRDDAEDVVQEAMMKVWKHVGRFEGRAALSTWLHRIVVNTALDHLRSRRHGSTLGQRPGADAGEPQRPMPEAVDADTPEVLLGRAEIGAVVRSAMETLSPAHREVLSLREIHGESYQEIADSARCPVGTVMSRLHHARHRLAETLVSGHADLLKQAA